MIDPIRGWVREKFELGLWVSVILLAIAVVLMTLIVRGRFPIPSCVVLPRSRFGATARNPRNAVWDTRVDVSLLPRS